MQRVAVVAHVRHQWDALRCGRGARALPAGCIASRSWRTCVTSGMHCVAVVAHVRHQWDALRCGRGARASPVGRIALRSWRTCVTSGMHCVAVVAHVRHQWDALRRGRGARASPVGRVASRSWRTCDTRRPRCVKVVTHVRHQRAALRHDTRERGRDALSSRTLLGSYALTYGALASSPAGWAPSRRPKSGENGGGDAAKPAGETPTFRSRRP